MYVVYECLSMLRFQDHRVGRNGRSALENCPRLVQPPDSASGVLRVAFVIRPRV
jgi:hypothetical protein